MSSSKQNRQNTLATETNKQVNDHWRPWEGIKRLSHDAPEKDFISTILDTNRTPTSTSHFPQQLKCDFEVCNATFKRGSELKRHKQSKHFRRPERCKACNQEFTRKDNLTRHMKLAHGREKKPSCRFCKKDLSRRDAVQRHESTCNRNPSKNSGSNNPEYAITHMERIQIKLRKSQNMPILNASASSARKSCKK